MEPVKKTLLCAAAFLVLSGCGSDAPTAPRAPAPPPFQGLTLVYVRETDLNPYLNALARILPDFHLIIEEQAVLFRDWSDGRLDTYWTRVYANNLILRIQAYSRNAGAIRPGGPELQRLHTELLSAMKSLEGAIADFGVAIDPPDDTILQEANAKIGQFNLAMDRYTTQLSNLAGFPITFFPFF